MNKPLCRWLLILLFLLTIPIDFSAKANAQTEIENPKIASIEKDSIAPSEYVYDSGDTAWLLASSSFVLLMTPGLAFFYGGLVRRENILSILMQCFTSMCLVTLIWVTVGYTLAFGSDHGGLIGGWDYLFLKGMDHPSDLAPSVPHIVFMAFQMKFAIIAPALIAGAFAERMKFFPFCVFTFLWSVLIYSPICHWVWGGGFLSADGALDFAGGAVVHVSAGMAALAAAIVIGKRRRPLSPPHNLPLAILGAGLLWFGWFGFNGGSALGANSLAGIAMVTTQVATAAAGLTWLVMDWIFHKKPTTLGMISGVVAGLVAITPAAGFVSPLSAIWIGLISAGICWMMVTIIKEKLGYDDALDAFGIHGIGGIVGALLTGLFASSLINPVVAHAPYEQFLIQVKATFIPGIFSFVGSIILLKILDKTVGLRVNDRDERIGLDLTQHKENAYTGID